MDKVSRLLTDEEIDNNWPNEPPQYDTIKETLEKGILIGAKAVAKAQDTKSVEAERERIDTELRLYLSLDIQEAIPYIKIPLKEWEALKRGKD